jgi:hypothetical protein
VDWVRRAALPGAGTVALGLFIARSILSGASCRRHLNMRR